MRKHSKSPKPLPSQKRLHELFAYDSETGNLIRKVTTGSRSMAGMIAGGKHKAHEYWRGTVDSRLYQSHRIVWQMFHGEILEGLDIDHISGDRSDNRIENLRLATRTENMQNRSCQSNNSSGWPGVYWHKRAQKWQAQIWVNGVYNYLGLFALLEDAIHARIQAEIKYFGEYRREAA